MTPSSTRRARRVIKSPEIRREELLDAAARLVALEGSTVAVASIAAAAGTATGNVYRYFDSREALLAALKTRVVDVLLERLAGHLRADGDWWEEADALLEETVDFWLFDDPLHRVVLAELGDVTRDAFDTSDRRVVDVIAEGLRIGIRQGVVAAGDPDLAASLIVHAVFGTLQHAAAEPDRYDRSQLLAAVREMAHKMLAAAEES
jgi:AcrR family transcriptional regulator